jgi:hypothetical protein
MLKHCAAKETAFSIAKHKSIYMTLKFLALQAAPYIYIYIYRLYIYCVYIYDIIRLRVNVVYVVSVTGHRVVGSAPK